MKKLQKKVPLGVLDVINNIEFLTLAALICVSFTYLHYTVPIKIFTAADWLNGVVDMPMAGRALAGDVIGWMVRSAGLPSDSGTVPLAFQGLEFAAILVASLAVPVTVASLTNDRQAAYLAYGLFIWQVFYTFIISPRHRFWYTFDIVTLAIQSLTLLLIVQNRFSALLVLSAVGAWNRETAVLIALFYALYNLTGSGRSLRVSLDVALRTAALLIVWLVVRSLVLYLHGQTSGMVSPYHDGTTLRLWRNLMIWQGGVFVCLGAFGFLWILAPRALAIIGQDSIGRLAWAFPLYFAGMLVVGNIDEIRIFAEFVPYLAVILAVAQHRRAEQRVTAAP